MMTIRKTLIVLAALMAVSIIPKKVRAQYDFMFTQYMWNEVTINPAYTGSRDALSLVGLYRNQWVGMKGAPTTKSLTVNAPVYKERVGLGVSYLKDEIGVNSTDYFSLSYSYRIRFPQSSLSFGLSTSFGSLKEYYSRVGTSDPDDPQFREDSPRANMPNAGFGVYYSSDRYYVGFSVPRLIKNQVEVKDRFSVTNKFDYKYMHYFLTAGSLFNLTDGLRLQPSAMLKMVQAAPVEIDFTAQLIIKDTFWVGAGWRSGDAVSFLASVFLTPQLRIGYAFDYTLTDLAKYSQGTHEICFGYDFNLRSKKIVSPRIF